MEDKNLNVEESSDRYCFNELSLKEENDRIDREGIDKFKGTAESETRNAFEILESIQDKPYLFKQVFDF